MDIDQILENAWYELLTHYKNGHIILNEEDMRCLLYHLCAKELCNINYIHSQERIDKSKQKKYDLVLGSSEIGNKIAVELKCWLFRSSGVSNAFQKIKDQFERLENAVKSKQYDHAFIFVLDEFGTLPDYFDRLIPNEPSVYFRYFSPECMKKEEKWSIQMENEPCLNCEVKIPCLKNQNNIKKWQSKGYLK